MDRFYLKSLWNLTELATFIPPMVYSLQYVNSVLAGDMDNAPMQNAYKFLIANRFLYVFQQLFDSNSAYRYSLREKKDKGSLLGAANLILEKIKHEVKTIPTQLEGVFKDNLEVLVQHFGGVKDARSAADLIKAAQVAKKELMQLAALNAVRVRTQIQQNMLDVNRQVKALETTAHDDAARLSSETEVQAVAKLVVETYGEQVQSFALDAAHNAVEKKTSGTAAAKIAHAVIDATPLKDAEAEETFGFGEVDGDDDDWSAEFAPGADDDAGAPATTRVSEMLADVINMGSSWSDLLDAKSKEKTQANLEQLGWTPKQLVEFVNSMTADEDGHFSSKQVNAAAQKLDRLGVVVSKRKFLFTKHLHSAYEEAKKPVEKVKYSLWSTSKQEKEKSKHWTLLDDYDKRRAWQHTLWFWQWRVLKLTESFLYQVVTVIFSALEFIAFICLVELLKRMYVDALFNMPGACFDKPTHFDFPDVQGWSNTTYTFPKINANYNLGMPMRRVYHALWARDEGCVQCGTSPPAPACNSTNIDCGAQVIPESGTIHCNDLLPAFERKCSPAWRQRMCDFWDEQAQDNNLRLGPTGYTAYVYVFFVVPFCR